MTMNPLVTGVRPEFGLGDRLRKAREIKGFEQRELAELLGIHRQSVAKYERGAGAPSKPVLMAWAFMTGVDLFWLRGEETPTSAEPWMLDGEEKAPAEAGAVVHPPGLEPGTHWLRVSTLDDLLAGWAVQDAVTAVFA